jgi:putative ATP-binding cassette transporter
MVDLINAGAFPHCLRNNGYIFLGRHRAAPSRSQLLSGKVPGGLRFGLVHVRDNLEPIFIYGGERPETDQLRRRFAKVVSNFKQLILWKRNLGFFTEPYGDFARSVPYWFLAAGFVAGRLEFGQVSQAAAAFASLHEALSIIVSSFPMLANSANVVVRLSEFLEEAQAAPEPLRPAAAKSSKFAKPRRLDSKT